jgi:hypothetical protein
MASSSFVAKRIAKEFTKNLIGNFTEPESLPVYRKMLTFRYKIYRFMLDAII